MNILIIDDHPLFSAGIKELIQAVNPESSISTAYNYQTARQILEAMTPDLVLVDLNLEDKTSGLDALTLLKNDFGCPRVGILSASEKISDIDNAIKLGAAGYIPKSAKPNIMMQAIDLMLSDEIYIPSFYLSSKVKQTESTPVQKSINTSISLNLTPRQKEVAQCLLDGHSNKVIAITLGISEGTVKLHVSTILEKLNVSNRSQAILKIKEQGLTPV